VGAFDMSDQEDDEPENYLPDSNWIRRQAEQHGFIKKDSELQSEIERLKAEIERLKAEITRLKDENTSLKDQRSRLVRYIVYHYNTSISLEDSYDYTVKIMTSTYHWPSLEWVAEKLDTYDRTSKEVAKP
jgi:predicted RNase H-like nuclease (RuvC/YqgF family)